MDITPYVDGLRRDLTNAAASGGPDVARAAEQLLLVLDPAVRMAMMEAISQAAAEITSEMRYGSVDVRLSGRDLGFVVQNAPVAGPQDAPATSPSTPADEENDEGGMARITLRIPESIKTRAEERANRSGHSLNTWLVNVIRSATSDQGFNIDIDLSKVPFLGGFDPFSGRGGNHRMSGWV